MRDAISAVYAQHVDDTRVGAVTDPVACNPEQTVNTSGERLRNADDKPMKSEIIDDSTTEPSKGNTELARASTTPPAPSRQLSAHRSPRNRTAERRVPIDIAVQPAVADYGTVLAALESVPIPVNRTRKNVKTHESQVVTGMCLGVVHSRCNGIVTSNFARDRPNLTRLLVAFGRQNCPPGFAFTSIQVSALIFSGPCCDWSDADSEHKSTLLTGEQKLRVGTAC